MDYGHGDDCTCRGFIDVIDSTFDTDKPHEKQTGYDGTFRIIDQMLWTDLYALHVSRACQSLDEFWSLAAEHPHELYWGPTTAVQRRNWRRILEGADDSEPHAESANIGTEG